MRTHNQTSAERREAVIDAAITEFSQKGMHGTATEDIARRAGISQPYIFRLFGTKKELFMAAASRVCDRIASLFGEAATRATASGDDILGAMGESYTQLLRNREELLMLLQTFAASADADVQAMGRARMEDLFERVKTVAQVDDAVVRDFFAQGMLLAVLAAVDAPHIYGFPSWREFYDACADLTFERIVHGAPPHG